MWSKEKSSASAAREERRIERNKKPLKKGIAKQINTVCNVPGSSEQTVSYNGDVPEVGVECDAVLLPITVSVVTQTDEQYGAVTTKDAATDPVTFTTFSATKFINDPAGMHCFSGLESYEKFMFVLSTLGPAAYKLTYMYGPVSDSISVSDRFFLILIKLRKHYSNFELSRLFDVSEAEVYNIFCTWIRFMYLQWKEYETWSSRDLVKFFSPASFKHQFNSTRVIVDGTECPVKKPKLPTAQQSTFSTYKNRNTVKVLAGVSPGGMCTYMSHSYGGSTSDRQIVERSSLPQICDPGDSVMSDKGFDVQDIFAPYDVAVNIPTFFKKKNRMTGKTVLKDRKIASKRVHVERFIGLAKTYTILKSPLNNSETLLSSEIIQVCFMLCNFRSGIVSPDS